MRAGMPAWVLWDLNGTLLDPATMAPALPVPEPAAMAHAALDDAVTHAMALTLAGGFAALPDLLDAALRRRLALAGCGPGAAAAAVERAARMDALPGAEAALRRLRDAGLRVAVLTNSA